MEHSPPNDEHLFVNRKNYHSINVQGVCDEKLRFINIVSKWPGSTHDSFILENSALKNMFETSAIAEGWLLGRVLQIKCRVARHFVCHFFKFCQAPKKFGRQLFRRWLYSQASIAVAFSDLIIMNMLIAGTQGP